MTVHPVPDTLPQDLRAWAEAVVGHMKEQERRLELLQQRIDNLSDLLLKHIDHGCAR